MAILWVVLYHVPKNPENLILRAIGHYGFWGVDLFFVLSGFLIGQQYFKALKSGASNRLRTFYLKRFLRTLPTYFALLLFYIIARHFAGAPSEVGWGYLVFLQNLDKLSVLSHTWSLCVEEHFYLVFPLAAAGIAKMKDPLKVCYTVLAFIVVGVFIRMYIFIGLRPDIIFSESIHRGYETYLNSLFYPTYTRLDGLSLGVLLGYIKVHAPALWIRFTARHQRNLIISVILIFTAALVTLKRVSLLSSLASFPLVSLGFSFLLLAAMHEDSLINKWKIRGITKLSILSYSMYLSHPFAHDVCHYIENMIGMKSLSVWSLALYFIIALILTLLLFFAVERPSLLVREWVLSSYRDKSISKS